ncbi:MAG: hypothetical protein P8Y80_16500 [Acidobacteriota bacterium]|jgi:hypothetical protein
MGKTNWSRVFLGGLLAGVVLLALGFAVYAIYMEKLYAPAIEALGLSTQMTAWLYILAVVMSLISGILAVWLYSAMRPRYGAGPKSAVIAGIAFYVLSGLLPAVSLGLMGMFPTNVLVIDGLTALVICVVATLAGAWVYKEQE